MGRPWAGCQARAEIGKRHELRRDQRPQAEVVPHERVEPARVLEQRPLRQQRSDALPDGGDLPERACNLPIKRLGAVLHLVEPETGRGRKQQGGDGRWLR